MNESNNKLLANSIAAIMIMIGLIVSSAIMADSLIQIKGAKNSIVVTGSAKQQITSDMIVWSGYYSVKAPNLVEAYKQLESNKMKVNKYLITQGVPETEMVFSSINTYTTNKTLPNGQYTNEIDYYNLSQTVTISSKEIEKITDISRQITELINEGVEFQSNPPQYLYTQIADLKVTMLAEATKDAKKRADMIAENAQSTIGSLRYADMGVIQITPLYSTEISDMGMNDTSSIEKEITAVVHCEFAVN
ncbi:MAG: SIMPL domain-containing protein [Proteocatella sp.]